MKKIIRNIATNQQNHSKQPRSSQTVARHHTPTRPGLPSPLFAILQYLFLLSPHSPVLYLL